MCVICVCHMCVCTWRVRVCACEDMIIKCMVQDNKQLNEGIVVIAVPPESFDKSNTSDISPNN